MELAKAVEDLGNPYVFKHSSPSADAFKHRRSRMERPKRGRLKTSSSPARYEKAGRMTTGFRLLRPCVRKWCLQCSEDLEAIMLGWMRAPKMYF